MSKNGKMPSELMRRLLDMIDWVDGRPYANTKISHMQMKGNLIGNVNNGYRYIVLGGYITPVHRLRFWGEYGYLPEVVDHIDHDGDNNRLSNLRGVSRSQNVRYSRNNKHYYHENRGNQSYYHSSISIDGIPIRSPKFDNEYEAMSWYYTMALNNNLIEYVI